MSAEPTPGDTTRASVRRTVQRTVNACHGPRVRRVVPGFTLVELMVAIAVMAILMAIAIPSFRTLTLSNRLTSVANGLVGSINAARMEAIKRNASSQFCSNSKTENANDLLGAACATQLGAVYALAGAGTVAQVRTDTTGINAPLVLHGDVKAIRFGGDGLGRAVTNSVPYTGVVVDVCTSKSVLKKNNHRVINMTAGSIVTSDASTGDCP